MTLMVVGLAILLWRLIDVVLLIFAGGVLAVVLNAVARLIERFTPLRRAWALAAGALALLVVLAGSGALLGWRIADEIGDLTRTVSHTWEQVHALIERDAAGRAVMRSVTRPASSIAAPISHLTHAATGALGAVVDCLVVVFIGLFLAADPQLYRRGLLSLVPPSRQRETDGLVEAIVLALRQWLAGVAVAMLCVGAITGIGLSLLGVPLALSLALLAGLLEFIPYVGPIASAVPAILVGFAASPRLALEVTALYLLVHLLEGYALVPVIQKRAVALPPALAITAVVTFGVLFGPLGIVLSHPLMVTIMVLVRELYVGRLRVQP